MKIEKKREKKKEDTMDLFKMKFNFLKHLIFELLLLYFLSFQNLF